MEEKIKISVLCGGKFSFPSLQLLGFENFLCGVGLGKADPVLVDSMKEQMEVNNIAFKEFPDKASMKEMRAWLDEVKPDFIFSISFPFLVPEDALKFGHNKFINFHPGPLPRYRGPKPIFEVLRHQEKTTAVSVHYMNAEFDKGNLIFMDPVVIENTDVYGKLAVKLSKRTGQAVINMANMLQFGTTVPNLPQDESLSCYFSNPELYDTLINWKRMSASEIIALVNACNPWNNGADSRFQEEHTKIISAYSTNEPHNKTPGTVLSLTEEGNIKVACIDDEQIVIELLSTDSGIMSAKRYASLQPVVGYSFT